MVGVFDVVIIGSGSGGLTAAMYSGRYARKTAVVVGQLGGVTAKAGEIENWPGVLKINGMELMNNFKEHAAEYGVEFFDGLVNNVKKKKDLFEVDLGDKKISGKTVIFALGTKTRELGVPGEEKLKGKGVSYCATCDGMFFKGKNVVIVGGADSACKAAVYLRNIANKVTIVYRKEKLRGEAVYVKKIEENEKIDTVFNVNPVKILGENKVEAIIVKDNDGNETEIKTDGVFVEIGSSPKNELIAGLGVELDESGYVRVNRDMSTNVAGVYALGDMTNTPMRQIVTSAGDGAIAANSAHEYLNKHH